MFCDADDRKTVEKPGPNNIRTGYGLNITGFLLIPVRVQ
ncbi:MAG: hypothetical protein JWR02_445 [Mucilaginibacter sp.]|nr:hypothetical protein [Mucilaginibacter sp.]